jgi:hypothetical protein
MYRLTVNVLAGGRTISGASVRSLSFHTAWERPANFDADRVTTRGEAVVVDLGVRGVLFATLAAKAFSAELNRWYYSAGIWTPEAAFARAFGGDKASWAARVGQPVVLQSSEFPVLAMFGSLDDPTSVGEIDPANMAASLGPGVALQSMVVEVVKGSVSRGNVARRIPWVTKLAPGTLNGSMAMSGLGPLADNLSPNQLVLR